MCSKSLFEMAFEKRFRVPKERRLDRFDDDSVSLCRTGAAEICCEHDNHRIGSRMGPGEIGRRCGRTMNRNPVSCDRTNEWICDLVRYFDVLGF